MKKNRHDKIIELIAKYEVETQEQLASLLKDEGYDVTQATVSRDIRQMKLSKQVTEDGRQKYVYSSADPEAMQDKYVSVLKAGFVKMDLAQNILVIKTVSGMAMALAAAIDAIEMPQIVGCIAGDDTIMIAIKTNEEALEVMDKFREMLE
ncbi:arginine repressor [Butyrivibrio sp. INlla14]|uniref:arginine repressor n=1 Tax=Butyrivibrio sp. INlla14 TaxID=1520808 RepID=UPI000876C28F|nr:arginine repressor [Butyrivibrio sp. INlla14]SCY51661.1 transcriptional regulator, ArgR family [Butyrivibrio sp. INlla14]